MGEVINPARTAMAEKPEHPATRKDHADWAWKHRETIDRALMCLKKYGD